MHPTPAATPTANSMMMSATQYRYGPADVLRLEQFERPAATGDQVLVCVHAARLSDRG